jgi:HK97 family phage prohead protease
MSTAETRDDKAPAEKREVRDSVEGIELRAAPEGSKSPGTLVGYAAVFDKYSCDLGYFREKIKRGAFAKAIGSCDVRALVNHDPNQPIGRKSAGTLRMTEDEVGLRVEIDLPNTQVGRDIAENISTRNVQGQSFSFTTSVEEWDWSGDIALRTLVEVDELFDVGPVTFPAYEETSIALRSYRAQREERDKPPAPIEPPVHRLESERDSARLRLLEVS